MTTTLWQYLSAFDVVTEHIVLLDTYKIISCSFGFLKF